MTLIHYYPCTINPFNAELNPIRHLLALVGARHVLHVSRVRFNGTYVKYAIRGNAAFHCRNPVRNNLIVPSSGANPSKKKPLKTKYQYPPRNITEEQGLHLHHCGSLQELAVISTLYGPCIIL